MKRFLFIILPVILCACSQQPGAEELIVNITEAEQDSIPETFITYLSGAAQGEHYLTDENMALLYPDGMDIRKLCEDYAIFIGCTQTPYEIHLLHARAQSDIAELLGGLYARRDMLCLRKNETFSDEYRDAVDGARVYSSGRYAILIVTNDNDATAATIDRAL